MVRWLQTDTASRARGVSHAAFPLRARSLPSLQHRCRRAPRPRDPSLEGFSAVLCTPVCGSFGQGNSGSGPVARVTFVPRGPVTVLVLSWLTGAGARRASRWRSLSPLHACPQLNSSRADAVVQRTVVPWRPLSAPPSHTHRPKWRPDPATLHSPATF